jgi:hypothetical protein
MTSYDTLTEAISDLRRRDYVLDYNVMANRAYCAAVGESLQPNELVIQEAHRFEGDSNPDDSTVLFAIQSLKNPDYKGLLVAAYGAYADAESNAFMSQLNYAKPRGL